MAAQRWLGACAVVAVAVGAAGAVVLARGWHREPRLDTFPGLEALLVGGASLLAGLVLALLCGWGRRRLLRQLADQVRALRDRPSPQALRQLADQAGPELAPVVEQLEALS